MYRKLVMIDMAFFPFFFFYVNLEMVEIKPSRKNKLCQQMVQKCPA